MSSYFLYAEDDADDIDILQDVLNIHSKAKPMVCVGNGFLLLQHLQQIKTGETYPCLIILDAKLPKLNGIETLQLLKSDDMYCLIPVVVFSSKLSDADIQLCKQLGADVIDKPSSYVQWQATLDRFISYADE